MPPKPNAYLATTNQVLPHGWGYVKRDTRIPAAGLTLETPEFARLVAAGMLRSLYPIDSDVATGVVQVVHSEPTATPAPVVVPPMHAPIPPGVQPIVTPVFAEPTPDVQPVVIEVVGPTVEPVQDPEPSAGEPAGEETSSTGGNRSRRRPT